MGRRREDIQGCQLLSDEISIRENRRNYRRDETRGAQGVLVASSRSREQIELSRREADGGESLGIREFASGRAELNAIGLEKLRAAAAISQYFQRFRLELYLLNTKLSLPTKRRGRSQSGRSKSQQDL